VAEDDAVGSRVILRELTAADEDEFLGLAMFHRCRYYDTDVPSVRWRGPGGREREWNNGT